MVNRVLFLMEKFCDANPAMGPTNSESQLVGAIESTGLVREIKHFYFDVLHQRLGRERMAQLLLEDCQVFRPSLVIYTPIGGLLGFQLNPPNEVLNEIRKEIKLYTCLWDTTGIEQEIKWRWVPFSDYTGIMDSAVIESRFGRDPRILQAYTAIDPRDFHNNNPQRDIDVCFVGGIDPARYPQRTQYINFLRGNGINVVAAGGQREGRLTWEEYSGFLNRSKISLSWSKNPHVGTSQLKGRVLETMACGAMLIEDDGDQTRRFFNEGKDFIIFSSAEDLVKKIRYYLKHDEEREAIARSGHEKVTNIYNARNLYGYLFEKMGFELPDVLHTNEEYLLHRQILDTIRSEGC